MSFSGLCADKITITPWTGQDGYGKPTFGAPVEYRARVQNKTQMVRSSTGDEEVSNTVVFIDTTAIINGKDKITLPERFTPRTPPILRIGSESGSSKAHHTVVYC